MSANRRNDDDGVITVPLNQWDDDDDIVVRLDQFEDKPKRKRATKKTTTKRKYTTRKVARDTGVEVQYDANPDTDVKEGQKAMTREEQARFVKEAGIKTDTVLKPRKHVEKVGNLTIEFSDSKPDFDTTRFRDSDRKAQAQRILKHSGLSDFKVKPKTFMQVVTDNCREIYNSVISQMREKEKDIQKRLPYATFIRFLVRVFLNKVFSVDLDADFKDERVKQYSSVLKKNPQAEKELLNTFISMVNDRNMYKHIIEFAEHIFEEGHGENDPTSYLLDKPMTKWMLNNHFNKQKYKELLTNAPVKRARAPVNLSQRNPLE